MLIDSATLKEPIKPKAGSTLNNMRKAELIKEDAADVAPVVHGRWIEKSDPARKIYFECSHCGAHENKHTAIKGYYCWRCGAKMDGDSDAKPEE